MTRWLVTAQIHALILKYRIWIFFLAPCWQAYLSSYIYGGILECFMPELIEARRNHGRLCICLSSMIQRVVCSPYAGITLCMCPTNERRRYNVTSPLIGWAHTQNDLCIYKLFVYWLHFRMNVIDLCKLTISHHRWLLSVEQVPGHYINGILRRVFAVEAKWPPFSIRHFQMHSLEWKCMISIKISLKFVHGGSINNIPALVQIMARHRPGAKPLSETIMVILPTHICVTRPQWVDVIRRVGHKVTT